MKNKKIIYWIIIFISILGIIIVLNNTHQEKKEIIIDNKIVEDKEEDTTQKIDIEKIQNDYQNEDIIGYIVIPNVISYPVLQKDNNEYYLNHDIEKRSNYKGTVMMDYRTTFEDRKILIYGHSGEKELPFDILNNYDNENYFKENDTIYLYSKNYIYIYEIFSSYVETKDFDYVNINNFNGLSWLEHIIKLKDKSNYFKETTLSNNTKILILQTCSMNQNIHSDGGKYKLIIAKLNKIENNIEVK